MISPFLNRPHECSNKYTNFRISLLPHTVEPVKFLNCQKKKKRLLLEQSSLHSSVPYEITP